MQNTSIKAGTLRHVITLLGPVRTATAAGTAVTYSPVFQNVPAAIEPLSATDIIRAGQDISQITIPITIRYMAGVTANMRVQHETDTYVIRGIVDPDKRKRLLVLACLALGSNQ